MKLCLPTVATYIKRQILYIFSSIKKIYMRLNPVPVLKVGDHGFGEEEEVLEVLGGVLQRVVVPELSLEENIILLRYKN